MKRFPNSLRPVGSRRSTPPINYRRARVSDLRDLPTEGNVPLEVLTYERTSKANMVRRPRSHGHGSARIGGVVMALCVTKAGGEWWLEVEAAAFDEVMDHRAPLDYSPELLAALYRAVQARQAIAAGQTVFCTGRN